MTISVATGSCTDYMLDLLVEPNRLIGVAEITVAERGATWSFDNWDEREPWFAAGARHALIYEHADLANGFMAGYLTGGSRVDNTPHTTLRTEAVPLLPGTAYRLTFDAKQVGSSNATAFAQVLRAGQSPVLNGQFTPTSSWQQFSFDSSTGPDDGHVLDFVLMGSGKIAVDNVRLSVLP